VILCNGIIFYLVETIKGPRKTFVFCCVDLVLVLTVVYAYGFMQLHVPQNGKQLRVGVVQANIPQALKWDPSYKERIINTYVKLTEFISYDKPDLVVFPEAAYPGHFVREFIYSPINEAIKELGCATVIGGIRFLDYSHEYNSAFLISKEGTIKGFYDKINLVPFGEYIPFKLFFDIVGLTKVAYSLGVGDFSRGETYTVFPLTVDDRQFFFSTLICFEDVFPYLARRFTRAGAEFLIVITNDAWFGKTAAAYQHMQASVFRAVENNCYVVRAANTGVSGFISPRGKVLNTVADKDGNEIFVIGGVSRPLVISKHRTFFQYGGFAFKYLCVAFIGVYLVRRRG
jgi:apolipoprotein N-acyltransferase